MTFTKNTVILTGLYSGFCVTYVHKISGCDIQCRSTFRPEPDTIVHIPTHIALIAHLGCSVACCVGRSWTFGIVRRHI